MRILVSNAAIPRPAHLSINRPRSLTSQIRKELKAMMDLLRGNKEANNPEHQESTASRNSQRTSTTSKSPSLAPKSPSRGFVEAVPLPPPGTGLAAASGSVGDHPADNGADKGIAVHDRGQDLPFVVRRSAKPPLTPSTRESGKNTERGQVRV